MIDASRIHEWSDVYAQMAALHERDSKMFEEMRSNFIRVFQRKLDRFGSNLEAFGKEMEQRRHSPVAVAPQVMSDVVDMLTTP